MKKIHLYSMLALALALFAAPSIATAAVDDDDLPHPSCADFDKDGTVTLDDYLHVSDNIYFDILFDLDGDGSITGADQEIFVCLIGESYMMGDYNDDGSVNTADLLILLANYNTLNACIDLTGEGKVTQLDLYKFLNNYYGN